MVKPKQSTGQTLIGGLRILLTAVFSCFKKLLIEDIQGADRKKSQTIPLKESLFIGLSLFILFVAGPLLLYGAFLFFRDGKIGLALIEAMSYFFLATVILMKKISVSSRNFIIILVLYAFSILLLVVTAKDGAGMISVLAILFLSGLILETPKLIRFVLINIVVFIVITLLLMAGMFDGIAMADYRSTWLINMLTLQTGGISFMALLHLIYGVLNSRNQELIASEERLKESEEKYRYIFNHSLIGKVLILPNGEQQVNDTLCRMLGYNKEELEAIPFEEITHPDDQQMDRQAMERLMGGTSEPQHYNKRFITKAGAILWADVQIALRKDISGQVTYFIISIVNITARKMAERELILSNDNFKLLYEDAPLPYQSLDTNGHYIKVNKAWLELFGFEEDEVIGKWFGDFVQPSFIGYIKQKFAEFKLKGTVFSEFDMATKSGKILKIYNYGRIGYNSDGTIKQTHCIMQDVTEQLKIKELLIRKEEEQRQLLEELQVGLVIHEADTTVSYANSLALSFFNTTHENIIGRTASDHFWNFVNEVEEQLPITGYPVSMILSQRKPLESYEIGLLPLGSQEIRWVLVNGFPVFDENEHLIKIVVSFVDVTERRKREASRLLMESHLRNQQKLESIGTLASGVAHEINNPINGILNYSQIILDSEPNDPSIKEYAQEIVHETKRVAEIVKNLLSFSRQSVLEYQYEDIDEIITKTLSLIRTVIRHDQIELKVTIAENISKVHCRGQQIQQVIMNLLTNAQDALNERYPDYHPNKIMCLSASEIELHDRAWVEIIVEDHGAGIPETIKDKIFDPFYTTKGKDKGTGLGLSISYGIVKEHHGEIMVESEVNQFTRFIVRLPCDFKSQPSENE